MQEAWALGFCFCVCLFEFYIPDCRGLIVFEAYAINSKSICPASAGFLLKCAFLSVEQAGPSVEHRFLAVWLST